MEQVPHDLCLNQRQEFLESLILIRVYTTTITNLGGYDCNIGITQELIDILEGQSVKTRVRGKGWGAHEAHDIQTMYY